MFLEEKIEEDYVKSWKLYYIFYGAMYTIHIRYMYIFVNDNIFSTSINKYQCIVRKYI